MLHYQDQATTLRLSADNLCATESNVVGFISLYMPIMDFRDIYLNKENNWITHQCVITIIFISG